ncbi:uncharacterized protein LOC131950869 [Physella acuta]|uniref:uncharacterized protein LOC131950869 n=1 Tax=Physella acuta TaxID=109671 RepID=UPI0027DB4863|nr:uncharacterized protein LOC131950869 [Physella acuta]
MFALVCVAVLTWMAQIDAATNSTISCTRGTELTPLNLECNSTSQYLVINRVFYGAKLKTSNCSRTGTFSQCCLPTSDECVFENSSDLTSVRSLCSGQTSCTHAPLKRLTSSLGNCNQSLYTDLTSIAFVEYTCVNVSSVVNLCDNTVRSEFGEVTLDSNNVRDNRNLVNNSCSCLLTADQNSTLTFTAVKAQFTAYANVCMEDLVFTDKTYPDKNRTVTCTDGQLTANPVLQPGVSYNVLNQISVIQDKALFTSQSGQVDVTLLVAETHNETLSISVKPSVNGSRLTLDCRSNIVPYKTRKLTTQTPSGQTTAANILTTPRDNRTGNPTPPSASTVGPDGAGTTRSPSVTGTTRSYTSSSVTRKPGHRGPNKQCGESNILYSLMEYNQKYGREAQRRKRKNYRQTKLYWRIDNKS